MISPGTYPGLTMAEYLAMPGFSASTLKTILDRCEAAAWFESNLNPKQQRVSTEAQDCGSIAHGILLEGSEDGVEVIDPNDYPAKTTGNVPDGWTNVAIRAARDMARASGKIPVLTCDMLQIRGMVRAGRAFIESLQHTEPAIWAMFQPGGGESEVTMVAEVDGVLCRIRTDRMSTDRRLILDYKTSAMSVEPDRFGRTQMVSLGYYISASFYRRVVKVLHGVTPDYVFLAQETAPPYLCSLIGVDPSSYALGDQKVTSGLNTWKECLRTGEWPAYPPRVCYPELPMWESARWEERQGNDRLGIPYDVSKLFSKERAA